MASLLERDIHRPESGLEGLYDSLHQAERQWDRTETTASRICQSAPAKKVAETTGLPYASHGPKIRPALSLMMMMKNVLRPRARLENP